MILKITHPSKLYPRMKVRKGNYVVDVEYEGLLTLCVTGSVKYIRKVIHQNIIYDCGIDMDVKDIEKEINISIGKCARAKKSTVDKIVEQAKK
jgi:hypothetical protein